MAYKGSTFGLEQARTTLATNFYGTADVCETLKSLLPQGARVVNVCRCLPPQGSWMHMRLGWLLGCAAGSGWLGHSGGLRAAWQGPAPLPAPLAAPRAS